MQLIDAYIGIYDRIDLCIRIIYSNPVQLPGCFILSNLGTYLGQCDYICTDVSIFLWAISVFDNRIQDLMLMQNQYLVRFILFHLTFLCVK